MADDGQVPQVRALVHFHGALLLRPGIGACSTTTTEPRQNRRARLQHYPAKPPMLAHGGRTLNRAFSPRPRAAAPPVRGNIPGTSNVYFRSRRTRMQWIQLSWPKSKEAFRAAVLGVVGLTATITRCSCRFSP